MPTEIGSGTAKPTSKTWTTQASLGRSLDIRMPPTQTDEGLVAARRIRREQDPEQNIVRDYPNLIRVVVDGEPDWRLALGT